jgi:hypothetical protein
LLARDEEKTRTKLMKQLRKQFEKEYDLKTDSLKRRLESEYRVKMKKFVENQISDMESKRQALQDQIKKRTEALLS